MLYESLDFISKVLKVEDTTEVRKVQTSLLRQ